MLEQSAVEQIAVEQLTVEHLFGYSVFETNDMGYPAIPVMMNTRFDVDSIGPFEYHSVWRVGYPVESKNRS